MRMGPRPRASGHGSIWSIYGSLPDAWPNVLYTCCNCFTAMYWMAIILLGDVMLRCSAMTVVQTPSVGLCRAEPDRRGPLGAGTTRRHWPPQLTTAVSARRRRHRRLMVRPTDRQTDRQLLIGYTISSANRVALIKQVGPLSQAIRAAKI